MSQVDARRQRGKEMEEHLSSIHLEPWFSRIQMSEEDYEGEYELSFCPYCTHRLERPYWEPRYNGVRGRCKSCAVIWNLS
jgi:hypothetical protein